MSSKDKTGKMQDVIHQLESLTKKILEKSTPTSLVRRVWAFARGCIFEGDPLPPKDILQRSIHQVLDSVSTILPLINDFQKGDSDQKILAARVLESIEEYNRLIDLVNLPLVSDTSVILNHKIELPRAPLSGSVKLSLDKTYLRSVFSETLPGNLRFGIHEEDLFRMKAISLLKESIGLKPAISAVRNAPIQKLWDNAVSLDLVHARQTVCTFPGEVRVLTGVFQCKNTSLVSKLVDVKCTLSVYQTGFPAASQYMGGLTLSKLFLDKENIPELHAKQNALASALLPEGEYYQKAKDLIKLRKEAFELHKVPFKLRLQEHSSNFLIAGLGRELTPEECQTIHSFYAYCLDYASIADVHYWISQNLSAEDYSLDSFEAKMPLFSKPINSYIKLIYPILKQSLERISGTCCNPFDQLLISLAHYQQLQFFADFEHDLPDTKLLADKMLHHLDYEISLLGSKIHL